MDSYWQRGYATSGPRILIGTAALRIVVGGFLIRTAMKIMSCCLIYIRLRLVGFLAFCLLTSYFDAACIDMACFQQLPCAIYTFCSQCSFRSVVVFNVFDVPANTMLSNKLFQLFITLLVKPHKKCILICKNCL